MTKENENKSPFIWANLANRKVSNRYEWMCNRCDCVSQLRLSTVFCPHLSSWRVASEADGRVVRGCFEGSAKLIIRLASPRAPHCLRRSLGTLSMVCSVGRGQLGAWRQTSSLRDISPLLHCCLIGGHLYLLDHISVWSRLTRR